MAFQTIADGPASKQCSIGRVLINDSENQTITVQPYEAQWSGARLAHRPLFQTPYGQTIVPGPTEAQRSVRYEAPVLEVELLAGGELSHGSTKRLSDGGWGAVNKYK